MNTNLLPRDGEAIYLPSFFSVEVADRYFQKLLNEVEWREETIRIFGKQILQPRQTAWYGDHDYSYSSIVMRKHPWISVLPEIKKAVESVASTTFNGVLLNHYRSGQDSMGWHRDNEKELGPEPIIASVSLGRSRRFIFRHREEQSVKVAVNLEHGSLLVMRGLSQQAWEHSLPKTSRSSADAAGPAAGAARINLTFRHIFTN